MAVSVQTIRRVKVPTLVNDETEGVQAQTLGDQPRFPDFL